MDRIRQPATAKALKGRTIAGVELQQVTSGRSGRRVTHLARIDFTDGSSLVLNAVELVHDYAIEPSIYVLPKGGA